MEDTREEKWFCRSKNKCGEWGVGVKRHKISIGEGSMSGVSGH